jgi:hypothetical protein
MASPLLIRFHGNNLVALRLDVNNDKCFLTQHKRGSLGQAYPSAERMQLRSLSLSNGLLK